MTISKLLSSHHPEEIESQHAAKYLRVIIYVSLALNAVYCLILFYSLSNPETLLIANGGLFIIHIVSFFMLQRKQVKQAVIFNLAGAWLCLSFMSFIWGGAYSPTNLGFLILVLLAGLLLNNRWAYFFTLLSIAYAILVYFIEITNQLTTPIVEVNPLYSWGGFIIAILVLVIVYELSTEKLHIALRESRQNVKDLNKKNKLLIETQNALQANLSELSRTESALRLSQKQLQTVVQSAPVILWRSDIDGRMTLIEGKTLSNIDIQVEHFKGETIYDLLGDKVNDLETKIKDVFQGKTIISVEKLKGRTFEIHFSPLYEKKIVNGMIGVAIDVTERAQAQDAMIHLQKTESLGVLAGGIAHDFNNLLVGVLGQASVGLYKLEDDHSARKHIEKAILAAEKAGRLTNQLLAYSGRGQSTIESVDINELVKDNISLFKTATMRQVTFQVSTYDHPLTVNGDATQLQQIVMNLIINGVESIKHNNGIVQINTYPEKISSNFKQTDWIGNELIPGEYAIIEISDNGIGMTEDVLRKIFDPFFTTKKTGQGLGLAAVQGIVRSHKGSLYVSSELNIGTTFKVFLPLSKNIASQSNSLNPSSFSQLAAIKTVLQIDNEQTICETLKDLLETQDINVLSSESREEGLSIFLKNQQEIDLIILDMTMPGMTLDEFIAEVQKNKKKIPIILSSGFDQKEALDRINNKMVKGFISKPYSVNTLFAQLQNILDKNQN